MRAIKNLLIIAGVGKGSFGALDIGRCVNAFKITKEKMLENLWYVTLRKVDL